MNRPLAPDPILRAALRVLYIAGCTTRNWTLSGQVGVSTQQTNALWEAIHGIPDLLQRWGDDEESLKELRAYLREYDARWDSPKLERVFDQALEDPQEGRIPDQS